MLPTLNGLRIECPFPRTEKDDSEALCFLMTSVVDATPLGCKPGNADTGARQRRSYDMFIEQICTNPSRRREKIATRTIKHVLQQYGSSYDITRVFLKVKASNTDAIEAYAKMGFKETSRRRSTHASTATTTTTNASVCTRSVGCVHELDSSDNDDDDMLESAVWIDRHNSKDTIEMEIMLTEVNLTSLDTNLTHKRPKDYTCPLSFTQFKCTDIMDSVLKGVLPTTGLQHVYTHQTYTNQSKQDLLIPDTFLLNLKWEKAQTLLQKYLNDYEKLFKGIQLFYNVWNVSDSKHYCRMLNNHSQNQMSFKPYHGVTKWSDIAAAEQEARIYSMYVDMLLQLNPPRYMLPNMQVKELTKSFQKTQNLSFNENWETTTIHVAFDA